MRICPVCSSPMAFHPRKIGRHLVAERKAAKVLAKDVARVMRISPAYLCDLEAGKRNWTQTNIDKYKAAIVRLSKP